MSIALPDIDQSLQELIHYFHDMTSFRQVVESLQVMQKPYFLLNLNSFETGEIEKLRSNEERLTWTFSKRNVINRDLVLIHWPSSIG